MAWHDGRTFYQCGCGGRDERTGDAPPTQPCWNCEGGSMAQWVPPAVTAERAAQAGIAEPISTLI